MINEVLEVQEYLKGNNINPKCIYRICYMIAKWYAGQGLSHLAIREKIFEWGKENNIYIECNVNNIINQVMEDKTKLRENVIVKINENDIQEINKRFDTKNCKLLSLAILSYAKCAADSKGEFNISLLALSNWIGIAAQNISNRYLPELINFGYVEKITEAKQTFSWNKTAKSKSIRLKINVPLHNSGKYEIAENDIFKAYDLIFAQK